MQEAYRIGVPKQTATFTISRPLLTRFEADKLFAPLLQENRQVEWYESVQSFYGQLRLVDVSHLVNIPDLGGAPLWHALPRRVWPTLLICGTPAEASEIRDILIERSSDEPFEASEPLYGFRERFTRRVQAEGKHVYQYPHGESYGHVILDIQPDSSLDEVVFESQVDEETIPEEFLPDITSALREAVFRGGPGGYPLSGFRATLIGGSVHLVDSNARGYQSATLLALWDAFRLSDTRTVEVRP